MADYRFVTYETLDDGAIARIMMNRPDARNAQNVGMLREMNNAFLRAEADEAVRVVVLGGLGTSFSSGHDLGTPVAREEREKIKSSKVGADLRWSREWDYYLGYTRRWRDLQKITIAQVQGHCISAGLMLAWCCDLIVAAENATFTDVVGGRLGMCGVEYFAHPWELGPRKAKELLLTGDSIDAEDAYRLGMVSKVFPQEKLEEETLDFARRIAKLPSYTSLLIKQSVNQSVDMMGFYNALQACFTLHQLNHSHWGEVTAAAGASGGQREWAPIRPAQKSSSGLVK